MKCKWCFILFWLGFLCMPVWSADSHASGIQVITEEWPPISFSKGGRIDGLGVEVVREILSRVGIPDNIRVFPWARAWVMVRTEPNIILFTVTRTDEREKLFTMIGPVAVGTTNFYAKKGSGIIINNMEDAKKLKRIGLYRSSVEEQILIQENFKNLDATSLPVFSAKKLMSGRIDLWCNANLTVGKIMEEAGFTPDDVENVYTIKENHLYIAISKGTSKRLVGMMKEALESIKKDGTFAGIYNKWLPGEKAPEKTEILGGLQ